MGFREHFWGPVQARSLEVAYEGNPKAQIDERAAELGIQLEPGNGPVNTADGAYQEARYVVTPRIVNPQPRALDATQQLAELQRLADERVTARAAARELANAALKAARAARRKAPDAPETLAELQRCRAAVEVANDDLAVATEARDEFVASVAKHTEAGTVARQDAAHKAQTAEALQASLAPTLTKVTALARDLGKCIKEVNGAVATMLMQRHEAEELAKELGMNYRSSRADQLTASVAFARAFAAGLKQERLTPSSLRSWLGV